MTQEERRLYLIRYLLDEDNRYSQVAIPADAQKQRDLLRALMNVRLPEPIGAAFLKVQDAYLSAERDALGVVESQVLPTLCADDRLVLWQGDSTTLRVDAVVNAANSALLGCFHPLHGCIDNCIHSKSGMQLRLFCNELMQRQGHEEKTGKAKLTPAFNLPSQYILHTVGPIVRGAVTKTDCSQLAACYRSCLEAAAANGCHSIAFCCISTGAFHFPNKEAAKIAVDTVRAFLKYDSKIERLVFTVFKDSDFAIYRALLGEDAANCRDTKNV